MSLLTPKWYIEGLDTLYYGIASNYTGQFNNGEMSGLGTIVYYNKRQFTGILEKFIPNGQGTMIYPDNSKHVGEWKNGKKHGVGTYTENGQTTQGRWENNRYIGAEEASFSSVSISVVG